MTFALPSAADIESGLKVWSETNPQLKSLIAQQTPPAKALRFVGLRLCDGGVSDTVVDMFMAATALSPQDAGLWNDLSTVLQAVGRTDDAMECVRQSLKRNPSQPKAWSYLGLLHDGRSQADDAEHAFLAALELDPRQATALRGLGFLYFRQRRFAAAAERLASAIACGEAGQEVHACLGLTLWSIGDFAGAANAFAQQVRISPEPQAARNWAQTRMQAALIAGVGAEDAHRIYRESAGPHCEDTDTVSATAFHQLSGFGRREAAITIGRHRLSRAPDNPVQQYLLAALEQNAPPRAPDDYLRSHFDAFAVGFDHQLVNVLDYHVPEKLSALLAPRLGRVLDMGCGTGLAGPLLRPKSAHLTGIDISPRMLEQAGHRGVYDALVESEILEFLRVNTEPFDCVFAADVLVYFGDLSSLMSAAARDVKSNGCFAFSIETVETGEHAVLPSGRFAHSLSYIAKVSQPHFSLAISQPTTIRIEANRPAQGALIVLERR
jgi:predicted TPR repeat methyltransferase